MWFVVFTIGLIFMSLFASQHRVEDEVFFAVLAITGMVCAACEKVIEEINARGKQ